MTTIITVLALCCIVGIAFAGDAEMKKWFVQQAIECSKEHPISSEEFQMMKEHKIPNNKNAKCIAACMFKKIDWMDDEGMFHEENAYKTTLKEYQNDQAKLDSAKKLYDTCKKVNDEPDDKEGCERATLLATCLIQNAPKLGFLI